MRKFIILLFSVFILSGCSDNSAPVEHERLVLTLEQQESYKNEIDEFLKNYYWYYDENSFAYFESVVPSKNDGTESIFEAVKESGYELENYSGKNAVLYTVNLMHFNGNKAGAAYFYFVSEELAGMYYSAEDNPSSAFGFGTRNVFAKGTAFAHYETEAPEMEYKNFYSRVLPNGFMSEGTNRQGDKIYLDVSDGTLSVYRFRNNAFSLIRMTSFPAYAGMKAFSATFYDGGKIAVMLGTPVENETEGSAERIISEKVVFLDENYNITKDEIVLTKDTYSCIASVDEGLLLFGGSKGEIYTNDAEGWKSESSYNISVQATAFKISDLDGDGNAEYILTDGKDLFIYRKNGYNMNCIWRTNISVDSFYGYIYTGDTNGDGAEEIYIADNTGTAIRYVISQNGLVSHNEDILYGDMFYVSDYNGDGKSDYIKSVGAENPEKKLFIAQ
ncbi:MAG: VCBS repeat-containing protein [Firmicutes bacterium]|nr:VCBS repeat-containing protein [Bacillota bacterium]